MKTDFKKKGDRALVERLLQNDQEAWEYVLMDVALRLANQRSFRERLYKASLEPMEAVTELCKRLYDRDFALLRKFAFRGSFEGWLRTAVHSVVNALTRKEDQGREIPTDYQEPTSAVEQSEHAVSTMDLHMTIMDKRLAFSRFWRENQESAFIVLMKGELKMSMDDIGALLGRPANTVVQKAKRALARLQKLEQD